MTDYLLVFLGGGTGALVRYYLGINTAGNQFLTGNAIANVLGSFLAGMVVALVLSHLPGAARIRLLFFTGFCGGLTTFSGLMSEFDDLYTRSAVSAVLFLLIQVLSGIFTYMAGRYWIFHV